MRVASAEMTAYDSFGSDFRKVKCRELERMKQMLAVLPLPRTSIQSGLPETVSALGILSGGQNGGKSDLLKPHPAVTALSELLE